MTDLTPAERQTAEKWLEYHSCVQLGTFGKVSESELETASTIIRAGILKPVSLTIMPHSIVEWLALYGRSCEREQIHIFSAKLKLAKTRLEICLGRFRACHEAFENNHEMSGHGVSLVEVSGWIEDMEAEFESLLSEEKP